MTPIYQYCPRCAAPLHSENHGGFERRVCPAPGCGFIWWNNPTPVVAAVVEYQGKIVLARNAQWTTPFFALITGYLERNEDPAEAILREVKEELDLDADHATLIGHYTFERMNQLIIAYQVEATGTITLNEELAEYKLIEPERARYWPAATGLALRDYLRAQGFDPQPIAPRRADD